MPFGTKAEESKCRRKKTNQKCVLFGLGIDSVIKFASLEWVLMAKITGEDLLFWSYFRKLYIDISLKDSLPLLMVDYSLSMLGKANCFSSLELASAFRQSPLKKEDLTKTTFTSQISLNERKTTPKSCCIATASFIEAMKNILSFVEQKTGSLISYHIDKIIINNRNVENHLV